MNIARIKDGTVINIEIADDEWTEQADDDEVTFIAYDDTNPAFVGLSWSQADGFEQPPVEPSETE